VAYALRSIGSEITVKKQGMGSDKRLTRSPALSLLLRLPGPGG